MAYTNEEARREAVLVAGADTSQEKLERIAILFDRLTDVDIAKLLAMPLERRLIAIERLLARKATDVATVQATETAKWEATIREAVRETQAQGGMTPALERFISWLPGDIATGVDPALLARITAALPGADSSDHIPLLQMPQMISNALVDILVRGQSDAAVSLEAKALRVGEEGVSGATASLVRSAEFVLAQLGKAAERLEHAAVATEKASERPTYDQRNAKFLTVDAESRARRRRNGETLARQRCER